MTAVPTALLFCFLSARNVDNALNQVKETSLFSMY